MASPPKLGRVLETALYVDDLERAAAFYEQALGLTSVSKDSRFHAYDVGGISVLLLFKRGATLETVHMPGGTIPPHDGNGPIHMAFAVGAGDLPAWERVAWRSRAGPTGRAAATASISATRTGIFWNW